MAAEVDEKSEYSSERKRKEEETRFFFMAAVSAVDGGGCVDSDFQRDRKSLRDEESEMKRGFSLVKHSQQLISEMLGWCQCHVFGKIRGVCYNCFFYVGSQI